MPSSRYVDIEIYWQIEVLSGDCLVHAKFLGYGTGTS